MGSAVLLGCETPRIFTPPLRPLTPDTSLGFEAVEFADWVHERIKTVAAERDEAELLELAPRLLAWQRWFLIHALELLPGMELLFRFRIVLLLVARQNGKTTVMVYLILWRLFNDGARKILGSAQTLDVAEETWEIVVAIGEAIPELDEEIKKVTWGSGKRALTLESNEKYQVVPSTRGGGRSKTGDLVLCDELREHATWDAWAAISKTTMARPRAQLYGVSNAGDASSVVLRALRIRAHAPLGDPDGLRAGDVDLELPEDYEPPDEQSIGIFEWSAPPGMAVTDRAGWPMANPALGFTITERAIASALTDPEWVFRTEVLCQWNSGSAEGPFPAGAWELCLDVDSTIRDADVFGVGIDRSADGSFTYVALCALNQHGVPHVEVVAQRAGDEWVAGYILARPDRFKIGAIALQSRGATVSPMAQALRDAVLEDGTPANLPVIAWEGPDLAGGTRKFFDAVIHSTAERLLIAHPVQPTVDVAAATAAIKPVGDGAWVWNRRQSPTDIAPLVAETAALFALTNRAVPTTSAYEDSDLLIA